MSEAQVSGALATLGAIVTGMDGDERAGQQELVREVARSIAHGHHLLAEAPTGSGKSIAYLAPIVSAGVQAVVATATLTLQDQLWRKDIPLVREHSGKKVTSAVLKGRSNYLCRARLAAPQGDQDALFDERPGPTFAADVAALRRFADSTTTGDIADLDESVAPSSVRAMTVGPQECPGATRCEFGPTCFTEVARSRAETVDIIVVNHALYAAHLATAGQLLPAHELLVVDEAHAFDAIVTNALGAEVTAGGLRQLAGRLRRAGAAAAASEAVAEVAGRLETVLEGGAGRVDPTEEPYAGVLAAIAQRIADATPKPSEGEHVAAAQAIRLAAARLAAVRRFQTPVAGEVVWIDGGERPVLQLAPVSVGPRLAPLLFATVPVVMVSATLGPGARFEPLAESLGLDAGAEPGAPPTPSGDPDGGVDDDTDADTVLGLGYEARRVPSPFDLRAQGMLYVARHLPDVRDGSWADAASTELCELVDAAGGRALVLCTSWRSVHAFSAALREATDHEVLAQGDDTTARLVQRFTEDETSCLVATRAFWQGLDVPGPACVLVVIDRLPFARPDEPLAQARRELAEREGGNGFRDVDLPAAALVLAQGAGRLIRTHADRGVVAVLDRRLATAGYRSVLLDAMPPLRRVVAPDVARAFLAEASGALPEVR